jgi:diaminopimelate epimerase
MGRTATIETAGGSLQVHWQEETDHVTLAGPATPVYRGVLAERPSLPR